MRVKLFDKARDIFINTFEFELVNFTLDTDENNTLDCLQAVNKV